MEVCDRDGGTWSLTGSWRIYHVNKNMFPFRFAFTLQIYFNVDSSRSPLQDETAVWANLARSLESWPSFLLSVLDVRAAREQINMGGVTYPTLPLQEAVHRPQSAYGPQSAACSPSGSFARPLPPQPHSAYFSGMTGPQHPFYNRVRQQVFQACTG